MRACVLVCVLVCVCCDAPQGTTTIFNHIDTASGTAHGGMATILDSTVAFYGDHRLFGAGRTRGNPEVTAAAAVDGEHASASAGAGAGNGAGRARAPVAPYKGGFYGGGLMSAKEDFPVAIVDLGMPEDGDRPLPNADGDRDGTRSRAGHGVTPPLPPTSAPLPPATTPAPRPSHSK